MDDQRATNPLIEKDVFINCPQKNRAVSLFKSIILFFHIFQNVTYVPNLCDGQTGSNSGASLLSQ